MLLVGAPVGLFAVPIEPLLALTIEGSLTAATLSYDAI